MAKTCKECKQPFKQERPLQYLCSPLCAAKYVRTLEQKKEGKRLKLQKESLLTRSDYNKMAQQVFNAYIRKRDKHLPCISCGTTNPNIQSHSGHYRSVGACPELRFNELNVHKQCSTCNNIKSGNLIEYRINLVKKIGVDKVEWLEGKHEPNKLTIPQLKELIKTYKLRIKEL
jgi:hypothetical protein